MKKIKLTKEEVVQEKEISNGIWAEVPDMANELKTYQNNARTFLNKNKKINIRISEWDYNKMKARAAEEGLPYQTLLSSVIHKYLTGQIKTT